MKPAILLLFLAAAAPAAAPAPVPNSPQACALSARGELAVSFAGNQPLVHVALDGKPATLLFDTGASLTMLTEAAAQRLQLAPDPGRVTTLRGIGGSASHANARVHRLQIGGAMLTEQSLAVAPFALRGTAADGLLGADTLAHFDIDIDLPHNVVRLFNARDCVLATPAWNEPAALKADISRGPAGNQLYLPVMLDGRTLTALIDSGADMGTDIGVVDSAAAAASGTTAEALSGAGRIVIHGAAPTDAIARRHRFGALVIGQETLAHPTLSVTDLPGGAGDLLIGILYLRNHRIWVSYASRRMYVGYRLTR